MSPKRPSRRRELSFLVGGAVAIATGCARVSAASAADPVAFHLQRPQSPSENESRRLQANAVAVDDDADDGSLRQAGDADGHTPCSLCQGVPVRDDLATPFDPNTTCAEFTFPTLEYCRSLFVFQQTFEACCQPSIPLYQCEQNVHSHIFDSGDYNAAVPPIVGSGPDDKLVVNVGVQFQALEEIVVEAGECEPQIITSV